MAGRRLSGRAWLRQARGGLQGIGLLEFWGLGFRVWGLELRLRASLGFIWGAYGVCIGFMSGLCGERLEFKVQGYRGLPNALGLFLGESSH